MTAGDYSSPMEGRVRELITPEGVDLRLVLAEAGERAAAFFLDIAIMIAFFIAFTVLIVIVAPATHATDGELIVTLWVLVFFFVRNFYFLAFEMTPRAATPGKRILGLRVAMRDGGPLTAEAIFARNAMRELELFLPISFLAANSGYDAWINLMGMIWCAVFVLFPLLNKDRLRIGDLVGGTWVVRNPKQVLDRDLAGEPVPGQSFTLEQLNAYGVKELNVLEDVLRRRDPLVVAAVAERIRIKTGIPIQSRDLDFLNDYYTALRRHLESRLLFGKRRRDKFDLS